MKYAKRVLALFLSLIMILGTLPMNVFAVEAEAPTDAGNGSTVILACSDIQDPLTSHLYSTGDYTAQTQRLNTIMAQVKTEYPTIGGFFCGGDYNFDVTREGSTYAENDVKKAYTKQTAQEQTAKDAALLVNTVKAAFPTLTDADMTLIQGNHDESCTGLTATGGYDKGAYSVYVINEPDYPARTGTQSLCQKTADGLRTWLGKLASTGYDKPVFILSHVPLHYSSRVISDGDALYAQLLFDAIDSFGRTLNIIFLYGHDHAHGDDDYLGGAAQFLTRGDRICVAQSGNRNSYLEKTLSFTYMNYGFVGYFWDKWGQQSGVMNPKADNTLTMTTFEINGSDVIITRWDEGGKHLLKAAGVASLGLRGFDDPLAPDTTIYESPQIVESARVAAMKKNFTDSSTGVTVKAAGSACKVDALTKVAALDNAGISDYLAYDISVTDFIGTAEITLPAKEGYNRVWYVTEDGKLEVIENAVFNGDTVTFRTNHFSIYATGTAKVPTLTVRFYADKNSAAPFAQQILADGDSLTMPDYMSVAPGTGAQFLGFYNADTDGVFDSFDSVYEVTEDDTLDLYTKFSTTYYVTYHDDNGVVLLREPLTTNYIVYALRPIFYVQVNYVNIAWNTQADGEGTQYTDGTVVSNPSADLDLYPVLAPGHYVRFNSAGGTPVPYQYVNAGGHASTPSITPERAGYRFDGWYLNSTKFNFSTVITEETTLVAKWTPITVNYTVRLWTEKSSHPNRSSLADAQANVLNDWYYATSYTKSGTTGTNVSFTTSDLSNTTVHDTMYEWSTYGDRQLQVYCYDDQYGSYAQSMTNASVNAVNNSTKIKGDGSTVIDVFFRAVNFQYTLTDMGLISGNKNSPYKYTYYARNGELFGEALQRSGHSVNDTFRTTLLESNLTYIPYYLNFTLPGNTPGYRIEQYFGYVSYSVMNGYDEYGMVLEDGCKITWYFEYMEKGETQFIRHMYQETIQSAKERHYDASKLRYSTSGSDRYRIIGLQDGGSFTFDPADFEHVTALDELYLRPAKQTTDGFVLWADYGFDLFFWQIVTLNRTTGEVQSVKVAPHINMGSFSYTPYPDAIQNYTLRRWYKIDFKTYYDEFAVDTIDIVYQDSISNFADDVTHGDGQPFVIGETSVVDEMLRTYVFAGWYDNEAFLGEPFDFENTDMTMPDRNLTFYAKWDVVEIEVTHDADIGVLYNGLKIETFPQDYGVIPVKPNDPIPPEGMSFYGWMIDGQYYDFTEPLYYTSTLVAVYAPSGTPHTVTYLAGDGSGTTPTDANLYFTSVSAGVKAPGSGLIPPTGKHFTYWEDQNGLLYFPGDNMIVVDDMVLTARYASTDTTYLIYHPGTGSGTSLSDIAGSVINSFTAPVYGAVSITSVDVNANVTLSCGIGFTKTGYTMIGWNSDETAAAAGEVEFLLGEVFTMTASAPKDLYAVWKAIPEGDDITFEKTAKETAWENYFDIELNIQARTEEMSPSIVLLLDVSSSMTVQCAICGLENETVSSTGLHKHDYGTNLKRWDGTSAFVEQTHDNIAPHSFVERLPIAKASALSFAEELHESNTYEHCYVKLITFGGSIGVNTSWYDVMSNSGYTNLVSSINSIDKVSGTNLALGMQASCEALTGTGYPAACDLSNSYLILLSDGAPNRKTDSPIHPCGENNEGLDAAFKAKWYAAWSQLPHFEDPVYDETFNASVYMGPVWYADQLHAAGTKIFSVVFGNSLDSGAKDRNNNYRYIPGIGLDNDDYVASFSDICNHADTEDQLTSFYSDLVPTIATSVKDIVVTDPMGANIEFMCFVDKDGSEITAPAGASFDSTTKVLTWELPDGTADNALYYRVRVQNENFTTTAQTQDIPTNGTTRATYTVVINGVPEQRYQDAEIPEVDTYEGTLEFDKLDQFGNALAGVTFTLTMKADDGCLYDPAYYGAGTNNHVWSATAVSDGNGHVVFTHVPSGHSFTLTETVNPYLDTLPTLSCGATVSYGVTAKTGTGWSSGNILNTIPYFYVVHHAVHVNSTEKTDAYYDDFVDAIPMYTLEATDGVFDLTVPFKGEGYDYTGFYNGIRTGYIYGGMYEGIRVNETGTLVVPANDYDTPDQQGWCGKALTPEAENYYYLREVSEEFLQPRIISVRRCDEDEHVERYLLTAIDYDGADQFFYSEYGFIYDPDCAEEDIDNYLSSGEVETGDTEEIYDVSVDEDTADYPDMSCFLYEVIDVYFMNTLQSTYEQTTVFSAGSGYTHITDDDYFGVVPYNIDLAESGSTTANGASFEYDFHYTPYYVTSDGVLVSGIIERYSNISDAKNTTAAKNYDEKLESGSLTYCYEKEAFFSTMSVVRAYAANPDAVYGQAKNTVTVTVHADGAVKAVEVEAGDASDAIEAPAVSGLRFAGWYADEAFTIPADLSDVTGDTDVYARYIDEAYFTVQMINTLTKKVITKTRLITVIDDRDNYAEYGLEVTINGEKTLYTLTKDYASVNGYSPVKMYGSSVDKHARLVYQDVKLTDVADGTTITVTPYYVTNDGTRSLGKTRTVAYYSDHLENIGG